MANDVKLQEGHPVDQHLRPVKVGGEMTGIELSDTKVRAKDIEVDNIRANGNLLGASTEFLIDGGGVLKLKGDAVTDIILNSGNILPRVAITDIQEEELVVFSYNGSVTAFRINASSGDTDYCQISTAQYGVTILSTTDSDGTKKADLTIDVDGDITIDSATGIFIAKNNGTQFSGSAYAGMILGYTEMAYGTTTGRYIFTTSMAVITDNYDHGDGAEDHFLGVTFVVPPSNKVEIEVFLPYVSSADGLLKMGLATDTSATTLKDKFEAIVWDVDESDTVQVVQRWVIDGSDSGMTGGAWSAGESKTIYCMVKEGVAGGRLYWGDAFATYGDMTMKATALPATIGDGT